MKGRTRIALLLITMVAVVSGGPPVEAQDARAVAVILKAKNDVRQRPAGGDGWEEARRGQVLFAGHELRTGDESFCALIFQDDKSLLKISSRTEVTLRASEGPEGRLEKRIWVGVGSIWAKVTKQEGESTFEIETPTSVASVKGSICYDITDARGYTTLFGLEGVFEFANRFGSVLVEPGYKAYSDGIDPPVLSRILPGQAPLFGEEEGPGPEGSEGDEDVGEARGGGDTETIRVELRDDDGTLRELIIRYGEKQ